MKHRRCTPFRSAFTSLVLVLIAVSAAGQQLPTKCAQQRQIAELLSSDAAGSLRNQADNPDTALPIRLFAAYRLFQINSRSRDAATRFLHLLPNTEQEELSMYEMSAHDCGSSVAPEDLKVDAAYEGLESLAARAVLLAPIEMDRYVRYGLVTTISVHSEYGSRSKPVCRAFPKLFLAAVNHLTVKDRAWFTQHILDPLGCRVMMLEEE